MATHSSTLAWKIPWMEEPGRLQSIGSLRVGHDQAASLSLFTLMHWRRTWQPTQCSCLENPRDGGAWWAAVYVVAQSRTRLKWLSSSSSNSIYRTEMYMYICKCVYIYIFVVVLVIKLCLTLFLTPWSSRGPLGPHDPIDPSRLLCPWDFPGKNTGVGCHFFLQGIFLTQGLNLYLLHWQMDSLPLSHQGSLYLYNKVIKIIKCSL